MVCLLQPDGTWKEHSELTAFAVASLWLAHPLQTSSVTYICQRYECMMGLFYFAAVYFAIRSIRSERAVFWYLASVAAGILGAGAKEVIVTLPVFLVCYVRVVLKGRFI